MDSKSFTIHVPKRWVRISMIVGVTALIVAPLTAVATHTFDDVPSTHTFHADIEWLEAAGVTKGCDPPANDLYCPNDNVTRGQMAAFIKRLAENQVVDAGWVEGKDADALTTVLTGDTISSTASSPTVSGVTKIEEIEVSAATDGFLYVSSTSGWFSNTATNVLVWLQLDNTTCTNTGASVSSLGYGYVQTGDGMARQSLSIGAPAAVSQGNHTLTLCANPFNGNLSPQMSGAGIQALFTSEGSITVNLAGDSGPIEGASN